MRDSSVIFNDPEYISSDSPPIPLRQLATNFLDGILRIVANRPPEEAMSRIAKLTDLFREIVRSRVDGA